MLLLGAFTVVMVVFAAGVLAEWIPTRIFSGLITGLHYTLGITAPTPQQVRLAVVLWTVSAVVIVDGMALLLIYVL